jgi:alkanesulfonate monooxygenase SsuD/methylene tetrahydromethanopterin reductase-like flavin-dependent oxidoreductase (luciferase family)
MTLGIGVTVPSRGSAPMRLGFGEMARRAEAAGFDSVWCGDHV